MVAKAQEESRQKKKERDETSVTSTGEESPKDPWSWCCTQCSQVVCPKEMWQKTSPQKQKSPVQTCEVAWKCTEGGNKACSKILQKTVAALAGKSQEHTRERNQSVTWWSVHPPQCMQVTALWICCLPGDQTQAQSSESYKEVQFIVKLISTWLRKYKLCGTAQSVLGIPSKSLKSVASKDSNTKKYDRKVH